MPIKQLLIQQFRNLNHVQFHPHTTMNIFYGLNGSGKTSLLEAIYFLGLARSFRTNSVQRLIKSGEKQFLLFTKLQRDQQIHNIGIERLQDGEKRIRIDGEFVTALAPLAQLLPVQLLTTESHRYFHDGPKVRRQYLDWGVFHVEPFFYPTWQRLQRNLKQRNAGLKNNLPQSELEVWNPEIINAAHLIDQFRKDYVNQLTPILSEIFCKILPETHLQLRYSRGWSTDKDLKELLSSHYFRDKELGYTQYGPQRADLQLYAGKIPAGDFLSQGQQKLAAYALHLAQGLVLHKTTQQTPIYLIDDLPSELDPEKRRFITEVLLQLEAQVFVTCILPNDFTDLIPNHQFEMFHVEHGDITVKPKFCQAPS